MFSAPWLCPRVFSTDCPCCDCRGLFVLEPLGVLVGRSSPVCSAEVLGRPLRGGGFGYCRLVLLLRRRRALRSSSSPGAWTLFPIASSCSVEAWSAAAFHEAPVCRNCFGPPSISALLSAPWFSEMPVCLDDVVAVRLRRWTLARFQLMSPAPWLQLAECLAVSCRDVRHLSRETQWLNMSGPGV